MPIILEPQFLIPVLVGFIFLLAGFISLKFPPKKINGFYGYRTPNSMKDQEQWEFAQQYASKLLVKLGAVLALSSVSVFMWRAPVVIGLIIAFTSVIVLIVILVVQTEKAINKKFGASRPSK